MDTGAPEEEAVPAPLVVHVMLLLLETKSWIEKDRIVISFSNNSLTRTFWYEQQVLEYHINWVIYTQFPGGAGMQH